MAHMIEEDDFMFSVRETPWHGLGIVIQEAINSEDALRVAKLDWKVEQKPIFLEDSNRIPGYLANIRSDTGKVLGVVTPKYQIIQNTEAFAFTDALLGEGVKYETAGSLNNGKRIWMLAKMDTVEVLGDKIEPYMVFSHGHDGKNSVKVAMTPIRVVCNNTLSMAIGGARRCWSTNHMGDIQSKLIEAQRTLQLSKEYMIAFNAEANRLVDIKLTDRDVIQFINSLFPVDDEMTQREKNNLYEIQDTILKVYKTTPDIKPYVGTGWGWVNAISDFVGHSSPKRSTKTFNENRFAKIVDGHPIIDKAVALLAA